MLLKNKFDDRLNNEVQVSKNKPWMIRNGLHELISQSQALINNSQALRNKAQVPKNNSHLIRDEAQ